MAIAYFCPSLTCQFVLLLLFAERSSCYELDEKFQSNPLQFQYFLFGNCTLAGGRNRTPYRSKVVVENRFTLVTKQFEYYKQFPLYETAPFFGCRNAYIMPGYGLSSDKKNSIRQRFFKAKQLHEYTEGLFHFMRYSIEDNITLSCAFELNEMDASKLNITWHYPDTIAKSRIYSTSTQRLFRYYHRNHRDLVTFIYLSVLTIDNAKTEDAGLYFCKRAMISGSNAANYEIISHRFKVMIFNRTLSTVERIHLAFKSEIENATVKENESINVYVSYRLTAAAKLRIWGRTRAYFNDSLLESIVDYRKFNGSILCLMDDNNKNNFNKTYNYSALTAVYDCFEHMTFTPRHSSFDTAFYQFFLTNAAESSLTKLNEEPLTPIVVQNFAMHVHEEVPQSSSLLETPSSSIQLQFAVPFDRYFQGWIDGTFLEPNANYTAVCWSRTKSSVGMWVAKCKIPYEILNQTEKEILKKTFASCLNGSAANFIVPLEDTRTFNGDFFFARFTNFTADAFYLFFCFSERNSSSSLTILSAKNRDNFRKNKYAMTWNMSMISEVQDRKNEGVDIFSTGCSSHSKISYFDDPARYYCTAYQEESVMFRCRAQKYLYDGRHMLWYYGSGSDTNKGSKKFSLILENGRIELNHTSIAGRYAHYNELKIAHLQPSDAGLYQCSVGRAIEGVLNRLIRLTIKKSVPPYFLVQSKPSQMVSFGQKITLVCDPNGDPIPDIVWYKDNLKKFGKGNLTIDSAQASDNGKYSCLANSSFGSQWKNTTLIVTGVPWSKLEIIITIVIVFFVICVLSLTSLLLRNFRRNQKLSKFYNELLTSASYDASLEIDIERLRIDFDTILGEGAFGKVYKAELLPIPLSKDLNKSRENGKIGKTVKSGKSVAVKVPMDGTNLFQQSMLLDEMKIMMAMATRKHVNILALIGTYTKRMIRGDLFVVMEFCSLGNLLVYLQSCRRQFLSRDSRNIVNSSEIDKLLAAAPPSENVLETVDLLSFAFQIANGMVHLGAMKVIHRDLAARNILLHVMNGIITVKIADYGLSRQRRNYHMTSHTGEDSVVILPIDWMAPESLFNCDFSTESDMWSFGVLMWEMFTLGDEPYRENGLQSRNELLTYLQSDNRLSRPLGPLEVIVPEALWAMVCNCWSWNPQLRPTFAAARAQIKTELQHCSSIEFYDKLTKLLDDVRRNSNEPFEANTSDGENEIELISLNARKPYYTSVSVETGAVEGAAPFLTTLL